MNVKIKEYFENYKLKSAKTPLLVTSRYMTDEEYAEYKNHASGLWTDYNRYSSHILADYYVNLNNNKGSYDKNEIVDPNGEKNGYTTFRDNSFLVKKVVEYVEEFNAVSILTFSFYTRNIKKGEERKWRYEGGVLVMSDKTCITYTHDAPWEFRESRTWTFKENVSYRNIDNFYQLSPDFDSFKLGVNGENFFTLVEPFAKLFPENVGVGKGKRINPYQDINNFTKFMCFRELATPKGPKQRKVDELAAKALQPVEDSILTSKITDFFRQNMMKYVSSSEKDVHVGYLQKLDENLCVLRIYYHDYQKFFEVSRIYFDKKKAYPCKITNTGKVVYYPMEKPKAIWGFCLLNFSKEIIKGTMLEYYADIIDAVDIFYKSDYICNFIANPIIEQLYKNGFPNLVDYVIKKARGESAILCLKIILGDFCEGKTLAAKIGMNKYQMQQVQAYLDTMAENTNRYNKNILVYNAFRYTRMLFDGLHERIDSFLCTPKASLAALDNETFDTVFGIIQSLGLHRFPYYTVDTLFLAMQRTQQMYNFQTVIHALEDLDATLKQSSNPDVIIASCLQTFYDYISMIDMLNLSQRIKPRFTSREDLKQKHDMLVELVNAKKNQYIYDEFKERKPVWEKYAFDDETSEFVVIAPDSPEDLAREGMELHHCVKSYIDRVAKGLTNIMFIRKRDDKGTPFFTVEIAENSIQQVHGSCNRNADSEPGMTEFVHLWAKKCDLKTTNFNKVR